jgi:hypothetical protein
MLSNIQRLGGKGFLNSTDDAVAGGVSNGLTGAAMFSGQLGEFVEVTSTQAAKLSDSTVGTLYGGKYQYVLFKAGSSASNARGQVVYWDDEDSYVVTPDAPTSGARKAGITLNAVTKGQYGWIQVTGLASVLFKTGITKATPAVDDLVVVTVSANTADVLADATGLTSVNGKLILGVAVEAPVTASIKKVALWNNFVNL